MVNAKFDFTKLKENKIVYFSGREYPSNFFSLFFNYAKQQLQAELSLLDVSKSGYKADLEVSFLGQSSLYWLGNCASLSLKDKKKLYPYLKNYCGPHTIFLFSGEEKINVGAGQVEVNLDRLSLEDISAFFPSKQRYRMTMFMRKIKGLSTDQACMISKYGLLVKDVDSFKESWLPKIVVSQQSLFDLSKYFLFRDAKLFYRAWAKVADSYSPQFWIAFWSEQLWRAHFYVLAKQHKDFAAAKQISFRLPFDFIRSGWQYADTFLLQKTCDRLYRLDWKLKNGGDIAGLDLEIARFFIGGK